MRSPCVLDAGEINFSTRCQFLQASEPEQELHRDFKTLRPVLFVVAAAFEDAAHVIRIRAILLPAAVAGDLVHDALIGRVQGVKFGRAMVLVKPMPFGRGQVLLQVAKGGHRQLGVGAVRAHPMVERPAARPKTCGYSHSA
jgi:hypothetical protein